MNNISYNSYFKQELLDYIRLKQAIGYKFYAEAGHLKRFDTFLMEKYPIATLLTKEIICDWCMKRSYEAQSNQNLRASVIRRFAEYLNNLGISAYIIPKSYYSVGKRYIPYIYTPTELEQFFKMADCCSYSHEFPNGQLIMPVIFRVIYLCGLRANEAIMLRVADVDLINGVLTIRMSKNNNNRLVPMSNYLVQICKKYNDKVHLSSTSEDYYFASRDNKPISYGTLYGSFRRFLYKADISHLGKGKGPRIHDLRHTFAVNCLKLFVEKGKDLNAYLPILKTYMGHSSFRETAYYLHLTAYEFPGITLKLEQKYSTIIPQLKGYNDENN